jgi:hypothetical protein
MRTCETTNKYLAGLGGAVLLYIGVMGGTPALAGVIDVPGLPKTSAFVLWATIAVGLGLVNALRCRLLRKTSSRE